MTHVFAGQRSDRGRVWRAWLIAWLGGSVLAVVNGVARELVLKDGVGDMTAHYISTATLLVLLALYFWMLDRRWPLPTLRDALCIGLTWAALTASFDFGFGQFNDLYPGLLPFFPCFLIGLDVGGARLLHHVVATVLNDLL
jgi:hypothetical protein